ncbi:hypothetical protein JOC77_001991 [Peribacillus deserti]|uniref:Uncharacterized protein n=1 Tax=Peribacillus deserti TaxID=673318 RepID=A0ABS2QJU4_9BACI|nr:hypothetical protein [Peribacillus deserti]MBM7692561.1 hypothetical protein [Peribacillus deserti]
MFDPTAFENMKVVLEGLIYDRDFDGTILVTNRCESIDLSRLSRSFQMEMKIRENSPGQNSTIKCLITLTASLENLSAELLKSQNEALAGCQVETSYHLSVKKEAEPYISSLFHTLSNIWGENREIEIREQLIYNSPYQFKREIEARVLFGRLVTEDQIPDFRGLVDHSISSIKQLKEFYSSNT